MAHELAALVKRKLNITWSDADTDARVEDIIGLAVPTMRHKLGLPTGYDFKEAGQEQSMLLSFCLYEWNNAAADFDSNYLNDILQIRQKWEVLDADTPQP